MQDNAFSSLNDGGPPTILENLSMSRNLVLVRHGQSEWNLKRLFTGWRDPGLTDIGIEEAQDVGKKLVALNMSFEAAFASALSRAQHTLDLILKEIGQTDIPTTYSMAINERDYGDLSGISKLEAKEQWGEEQVRLWRRSYDVAPPNGESLKDTVARVLPFYCTEILPRVMRGESTIVVAHGNSLRALCMALDKLTPESVSSLEISTADLIIYQLNSDTTVASKKIFKSLKAIHDS